MEACGGTGGSTKPLPGTESRITLVFLTLHKAHFTSAVRAALFSCLLNAYQLLPDLVALSIPHSVFPSTRHVHSPFPISLSFLILILFLGSFKARKQWYMNLPICSTQREVLSLPAEASDSQQSPTLNAEVVALFICAFLSTFTKGTSLIHPSSAGCLLWDETSYW